MADLRTLINQYEPKHMLELLNSHDAAVNTQGRHVTVWGRDVQSEQVECRDSFFPHDDRPQHRLWTNPTLLPEPQETLQPVSVQKRTSICGDEGNVSVRRLCDTPKGAG